MMTLFHFVRVKVVWNRISNSCSFQPGYTNWGLRLVLELFWFLKWHVFADFCIILPIAARADFELWRTLTALWKVKSDWNEWKLSIMVRGIQIMWKFWMLTFSARTRTDGKFWNAQNDLKRALHWLDFDFEQF